MMFSRPIALLLFALTAFSPNSSYAEKIEFKVKLTPRQVFENERKINNSKIALTLTNKDQSEVLSYKVEKNDTGQEFVVFTFSKVAKEKLEKLAAKQDLCLKTEVFTDSAVYKNYVASPWCFDEVEIIDGKYYALSFLKTMTDIIISARNRINKHFQSNNHNAKAEAIKAAVGDFEEYITFTGKDYVSRHDVNLFVILLEKIIEIKSIDISNIDTVSGDWLSMDILGNEQPVAHISNESAIGIISSFIENNINEPSVRDDIRSLFRIYLSDANTSSPEGLKYFTPAFGFSVAYSNTANSDGELIQTYFEKCEEFSKYKSKEQVNACLKAIKGDKILKLEERLSPAQRKTIVSKLSSTLGCKKDAPYDVAKISNPIIDEDTADRHLELLKDLFVFAGCDQQECKAGKNPCGINP